MQDWCTECLEDEFYCACNPKEEMEGMTVAQLVTRLSRLNQNAAVFIYTDSGCRESIAIDATLEGIVDLQWEV